MKNLHLTKAITLGGIFAALYGIVTVISVYVFPLLSVFGLMIMPIFAAYYASMYKFKSVIVFNLTTLLVCFLIGLSDPFYCLLYVLPTLIIGDLFGLFNRLKIKYYATIFLQTIAFSVTNIAAIIIAEAIYETQIISTIISDEWVYENLSLCILFTLSGAEAVVSSLFISEEFKKFKIFKEKEDKVGIECYLAIIICSFLSLITYFFSINFSNLFAYMGIILSIPIAYQIINKVKKKELFCAICCIIFVSIIFPLAFADLLSLLPLVLILPFTLISIVKSVIYLYNVGKNRRIQNG